MTHSYYLSYRPSEPLTVERLAGVLSAFVGGPVATSFGELEGNPRDAWSRSATVTASHGDVTLALHVVETFFDPGGSAASTGHPTVTLTGPTYAARIATWRALHDAFAAAGCTELTLGLGAHSNAIVDDAEAAGDIATATRLRREITKQLVESVKSYRHVVLRSPRADDIEAVLMAYEQPEGIRTVSLHGCGRHALPLAFRRFPNVESLSLQGPDVEASVLGGVLLPKVTTLDLGGPRVRRLRKADVAGLPAIELLVFVDSALEDLDPDVIDACPRIGRVLLNGAPLERDEAKLAVLKTRWRGVKWDAWS